MMMICKMVKRSEQSGYLQSDQSQQSKCCRCPPITDHEMRSSRPGNCLSVMQSRLLWHRIVKFWYKKPAATNIGRLLSFAVVAILWISVFRVLSSVHECGFFAYTIWSTDMVALPSLMTYFHWPPNVIFTLAKTKSLPKVAQSLSAETDCNPKLSNSPHLVPKPKPKLSWPLIKAVCVCL